MGWTGSVSSVKRGPVKLGQVKRGLVKRQLVNCGLVKRGLVKLVLVKRDYFWCNTKCGLPKADDMLNTRNNTNQFYSSFLNSFR